MHPGTCQNQSKNVSFWTNIDPIIAKFCQYWKNKNAGWEKTRAIVSCPLIWNPQSWSPDRHETKWHPRVGLLPISRSILIIFLFISILNLANFEACRFPSKYSTPEIRTNQAKRFTVCPHQRGDEHSKQTMGFCNQTALLRITRITRIIRLSGR